MNIDYSKPLPFLTRGLLFPYDKCICNYWLQTLGKTHASSEHCWILFTINIYPNNTINRHRTKHNATTKMSQRMMKLVQCKSAPSFQRKKVILILKHYQYMISWMELFQARHKSFAVQSVEVICGFAELSETGNYVSKQNYEMATGGRHLYHGMRSCAEPNEATPIQVNQLVWTYTYLTNTFHQGQIPLCNKKFNRAQGKNLVLLLGCSPTLKVKML